MATPTPHYSPFPSAPSLFHLRPSLLRSPGRMEAGGGDQSGRCSREALTDGRTDALIRVPPHPGHAGCTSDLPPPTSPLFFSLPHFSLSNVSAPLSQPIRPRLRLSGCWFPTFFSFAFFWPQSNGLTPWTRSHSLPWGGPCCST